MVCGEGVQVFGVVRVQPGRPQSHDAGCKASNAYQSKVGEKHGQGDDVRGVLRNVARFRLAAAERESVGSSRESAASVVPLLAIEDEDGSQGVDRFRELFMRARPRVI